MTTTRALATVAIAAALALAGCAGPVAVDDDRTTTASGAAPTSATEVETTATGAEGTAVAPSTTGPEPRGVGETDSPVAVRGGTLPVNATVVYERVEAVMRTNATAPASVRVTNATAFYGNRTGATTTSVSGHARLERALGLAQRVNRSRLAGPNGATVGYGTVALYPGESPTDASTGPLLAHEFAHYVQFRQGRAATLAGNLTRPRTTDASFVRRAVLEGVAVAVETAYVREHHPGAETGVERSERVLDGLPAGSAFRYGQLPYVAGYEYVLARTDDPASATALYADPPQTSEQVLHATRDQPVALDVSVDATDAGYRGGVADRLGEAFLRVALANGRTASASTDEDSASATATAPNASVAAAGWGEDALVVLRRNGTTNHAWVVRFDTARDATQARAALAAVLDARGDRVPDRPTPSWRLPDSSAALHQPTNRTLALAVGTAGFVADLAVTATPGTVTVALDDANATAGRAAVDSPKPSPDDAAGPTFKPRALVHPNMAQENLQRARERIADAADAATDDDATERLETQAEEFATHAESDHGPDHGRLARHERILADIADTEGGAVAENVEAALEAIHAHRENLEGV